MKHFLILFALLIAFSACSAPPNETTLSSDDLTPGDSSFAEENFSKKIKEAILIEQKTPKDVQLYLEKKEETDRHIVLEIKMSNPNAQGIQSVQSWLSYPSTIFKGVRITIPKNSPFSLIAPGENSFDEKQGIAKIGISTTESQSPSNIAVVIAEVEFERKSLEFGSIEFFDPGVLGHTRVMTMTKNGPRNILDRSHFTPVLVFGEQMKKNSGTEEEKKATGNL